MFFQKLLCLKKTTNRLFRYFYPSLDADYMTFYLREVYKKLTNHSLLLYDHRLTEIRLLIPTQNLNRSCEQLEQKYFISLLSLKHILKNINLEDHIFFQNLKSGQMFPSLTLKTLP